MTRKLSIVYTLALLVTLCTTFVPGVEANNMASHSRMIKKRAGLDGVDSPIRAAPIIPPIGAAEDPNQVTDNAASATVSDTDVPDTATPTKSVPTNTAGETTKPPGLGLSIPPIGGTSASGRSTAVSGTATSANSTTSTTSTSTTPTATSLSTSANSDSTVVVAVTETPTNNQAAASATNTETSGAAADGGGHLTRNTIIAIVVVAACVGGAIVIWTVIRKWKFAPSDEFGDRLNPIDWRPTSSGEKENEKFGAGLDGTGVGHRRTNSRGSNRSFVSADAHSNNGGIPNHAAAAGGYNNGSPNNMIPDLPAHDFTAVPVHHGNGGYGGGGLAPVGAYADLRRGPSPTPSMGNEYYRGYGATGHGGRY